jgi:hypothetical protein
MKPPILITAVLVWLGSLAAVYWFGQRQGRAAGEEAARTIATRQDASSVPGKPPRISSVQHGGTAGAGGVAATAPSYKQILAQVKALIRTGGMNNPATGIKALSLLGQIREEDLQAALTETEDIKEPQQKMLIYMVLLGKWAEKDGPAAMKYSEEKLKDAGPLMQMAKMGIVSSWAQNDPEAVWKWYKDQEDKDAPGGPFGGRSMALMGLFSSMGGRDIEGAFKRVKDLESPEERRFALMGISQSAFEDDSRQRVMKEIDSMADPDERKEARQMLIGQWTMMEPEKATAYIESLPIEERRDVARSAGQMMMMSDPKKAAEFMLKNSEEKDRGSTYDQIMQSWSNQDPNAAGAWLGQQPQGPELDSARATFARNVASRDPESAMEWAKTVTEEQKRVQAVEQVYKTWRKKDAGAAEQALNNSGLPPEKVEEVVKRTQPEVKESPPPAGAIRAN